MNGSMELPRGWALDEGDTRAIFVPGTWAWKDRKFALMARALYSDPETTRRLGVSPALAWHEPGSDFARFVNAHGVRHVDEEDPFTWSTNLGGVPTWVVRLITGAQSTPTSHRDWQAGGLGAKWYARLFPFDASNWIVHSHGLGPILYGMAYGLRVRNMITIGSPIRPDMEEAAEWAKKHSRFQFWLHIYDPTGDKVQERGELFGGDDSDFGPQGSCPWASNNAAVPGVQHSNILYNPQWFDSWISQGWLDVLRLHKGE